MCRYVFDKGSRTAISRVYLCKKGESLRPREQKANRVTAKKRVKVINTKTMRNKAVKSALKTTLKKADAATAVKAPESEAAVRAAIKAVDQACAKGLMHKNCAARKKSQLAKKLNAAKA